MKAVGTPSCHHARSSIGCLPPTRALIACSEPTNDAEIVAEITLRAFIACSEPTNGAEVVAEILEHIGQEKGPNPHGLRPHAAIALQHSLSKSGSIRLKDSLMVSHMLQQEVANQEASLPEPCVHALHY